MIKEKQHQLRINIKKIVSGINEKKVEYQYFYQLCKGNNNVSTVPDFISKDIIGINSSLKNSSFYVLPNAIRAIFKGINFYISGDMSLNEKLYAPAILNFYTSAFHALESFLATNGILYFLPWSEGNIKYYQKLMVLRYCHGNQWKIDPAAMNHVSRWKELRFFFKDEASTPPSFIRLFNYLFNSGMCENSNLAKKFPILKKKGMTMEIMLIGF